VTGSTSSLDLKRTYLFSFGSPVFVNIPERQWRFDLKTELAIYLGQPSGSVNGGLVFYPSTKAIVPRGDLKQLAIRPEDFLRYSNIRQDIKDQNPNQLTIDVPPALNETNPSVVKEPPTSNGIESLPAVSKRKLKELARTYMKTRSNRLTAHVVQASADELSLALSSDEKHHWIEALGVELDSLLKTTRTITPETPDDTIPYDVIYATVVLKRKPDKYKVRICACGNQLTNYANPTYSPTVSMLVHSSLLQLSIYDNMHTATYDTVAAYLYQEYPDHLKPLYLKLPKRLALACGLDPNQLYRVRKYLYGLPDAGRAYYEAYSTHLSHHGYVKTKSDPCLFYKLENDTRTYVWIHVDDTFLASTEKAELYKFQQALEEKFQITCNYTIATHLGISLIPCEEGIKLLQPKLLSEILDEHPTSISTKYPATSVTKTCGKETIDPVLTQRYLRLLGKLMYMTNSRPDIITAVSYASTRSVSPSETDYHQLLNIVAYLRQTPNLGLVLHTNQQQDETLSLTAYVDAAYLSHQDGASHTGYTISIGPSDPKSFFFSKSTKQKLMATSSTHAEVRALYELTLNLIFLVNLFEEINRPISLPAIVFEDNQPAIDLVTNNTSVRSKHYIMLIGFIKEQVESGLIQLRKVPTQDNIANVLTKIVAAPEFYNSFTRIMGFNLTESNRRC
jgi:hypothetical protein